MGAYNNLYRMVKKRFVGYALGFELLVHQLCYEAWDASRMRRFNGF